MPPKRMSEEREHLHSESHKQAKAQVTEPSDKKETVSTLELKSDPPQQQTYSSVTVTAIDAQTEPAFIPHKRVFREALKEVGVIPDLQAIIWGYFERKRFTFGSEGEADGQFRRPLGICFDQKGLLYVCDGDGTRVQIFSEDGKWIQSILPEPHGSAGHFYRPIGIKVGPDGSVYICGVYNVVIHKPDGKFIRLGTLSHFRSPTDVAVNADGSKIYVADNNYRDLVVFTSDGKFSHYFGQKGDGPADMGIPSGVAVGPDDNIYVADRRHHRIQVYTPAGQHVRQICGQSNGEDTKAPGSLNQPWRVAVSSEGVVYVVGYDCGRVEVFSPTGSFLHHIEVAGSKEICGVALYNGMVYVSSCDQHRIIAFPDIFS